MASYKITGEKDSGAEYEYYETDVYIVDGDCMFLSLENAVEKAKALTAVECGSTNEYQTTSEVEHVLITSEDEICIEAPQDEILHAYQASFHVGKTTKILDIVFNLEKLQWSEKKVG